MKKKTLNDFQTWKLKREQPVAWITAYDLPLAQTAEKAEIDMILVGDSGGMVQLGYDSTHPVTMDEMIMMSRAVRRGAPNTFVIGDMPQGSYEVSEEEAVRNALRFIKEAGCDAVKCEGGERVSDKVQAMVNAGIVVFGHLGLTPQSSETFGGYRVQGKTIKSFESILQDAEALAQVGISALLLEAMPATPSQQIATLLKIPVYGIGAGPLVDGQLVIVHDLLGFYQSFRPWFAKCYIPDVIQDFIYHLSALTNIKEAGRKERTDGFLVLAQMAIEQYILEVKTRKFPSEEYCYPIKEEELNELKQSQYWKETYESS